MTTREEFFQILEPFHAPSTLLSIQLAYTLAKFSHRAQVRKETDAEGNPVRYFEHVKRVALVLINEVKIVQQEMVIAALLHDGIEDTRDLTPAMIEHVFGADVVTIVKTLSKAPKEGYLDRFHLSTDWRTYVIKACDRLDNLRSLWHASPEFQAKQIRETKEKYYPLFDRMVVLTPPEYLERVKALRDTVLKTTESHRVPASPIPLPDAIDALLSWQRFKLHDEGHEFCGKDDLLETLVVTLEGLLTDEVPEVYRKAHLQFLSLPTTDERYKRAGKYYTP